LSLQKHLALLKSGSYNLIKHYALNAIRNTIYARRKMAGKIIINTERCKGCGLCVQVCPKGAIVISKQSNKSGYFPAEAVNADCTGCAVCAIICPEAIIEVYREDNTSGKSRKKSKPPLIKEKA
jgi:2-oxoglutarate ferredoxin oxidoreductase subunit delta